MLKDNLLKIKAVEDMLLTDPDYSKFCLADVDLSTAQIDEENTGVVCQQQYSPLNLWSDDALAVVEPTLQGTALADMT